MTDYVAIFPVPLRACRNTFLILCGVRCETVKEFAVGRIRCAFVHN